MSVDKKTVSLYLRRDLLKRCQELHINISETVNRILQIVLERPGISDEEISLAIIKKEYSKIQKKIEERLQEIDQLKDQSELLYEKIEKQTNVVKEIQRSNDVALLIRQLNQKIMSADFNEQQVRKDAQQLLAELRKLGIPVDKPEWLKGQIERMRRLSH